MKAGNLLAGIALGTLVGAGIGYILGVDSEKKNQWLKTISEKLKSVKPTCHCKEEEGSCEKKEAGD